MSWYLIDLHDSSLTPYARETDNGMVYCWGEMPKRKVDLDELLKIAEILEQPWPIDKHHSDTIPVEGVEIYEREIAAQIRKAVGEQ